VDECRLAAPPEVRPVLKFANIPSKFESKMIK
jgi:hypothetical protein